MSEYEPPVCSAVARMVQRIPCDQKAGALLTLIPYGLMGLTCSA